MHANVSRFKPYKYWLNIYTVENNRRSKNFWTSSQHIDVKFYQYREWDVFYWILGVCHWHYCNIVRIRLFLTFMKCSIVSATTCYTFQLLNEIMVNFDNYPKNHVCSSYLLPVSNLKRAVRRIDASLNSQDIVDVE